MVEKTMIFQTVVFQGQHSNVSLSINPLSALRVSFCVVLTGMRRLALNTATCFMSSSVMLEGMTKMEGYVSQSS